MGGCHANKENFRHLRARGLNRNCSSGDDSTVAQAAQNRLNLDWISHSIRRMNRFEVSINLSAQEYLQYYRGKVSKVLAQCADGTTIQFPALLLQPFVTGSGVRGNFVLTCDENGKGSEIKRL
jgi:hypothetical protein